jgi:hypothetical protein
MATPCCLLGVACNLPKGNRKERTKKTLDTAGSQVTNAAGSYIATCHHDAEDSRNSIEKGATWQLVR